MSTRASAGLKTALVSDGVAVHLVSLKRYCWMMLVLVFTGVCAAPQSKQTAPCLLNLSQVTQICTQMLKKHTPLFFVTRRYSVLVIANFCTAIFALSS